MKTPQTTFTYPKNKVNLQKELKRLKEEEQVNVSALIVSCIEKELGVFNS
tara:strand:+ start:96 stop:245 length:150 start_codon:yes stop_codon:yes gene_type:complete